MGKALKQSIRQPVPVYRLKILYRDSEGAPSISAVAHDDTPAPGGNSH